MKPESFELYHKSGERRTIRLKAWGFAKRGMLRTFSATYFKGNPILCYGSKKEARDCKLRGEKLVELEVTIKAAPTKKTG